MKRLFLGAFALLAGFCLCAQEPGALNNTKVDGFRPIWFDLGQKSEYGSKYSGAFGTYTVKHRPLAIYSAAVDKTFFVFGGTTEEKQRHLLCMISCYDHKTGMVQKPTVVYDKGKVNDPHDNPVLLIDPEGYLWVYVAGRGNARHGFRYRSRKPFDISAFDLMGKGSIMAYPQPYYVEGKGHFLFETRYDGVRQLFYQTSPDGVHWTEYRQLASIVDPELGETKSGHYQVSGRCGDKLVTAFNRHLNGDCDTRTNIYFIQTTDFGEHWTLVDGTPIQLPVTDRNSPCKILDVEHNGQNCYIKDVNFDPAGNPIILYVTSYGHLPGPKHGPREWFTAHWNGRKWAFSHITNSTNNYDSGSLWVDGKTWMVIAPTGAGPQKWGQGGEVEAWVSRNGGKSWKRTIRYTADSPLNHCYVRRPENAKDPFWCFWADGNADVFSVSHFFFADSRGNVFRLPYEMSPETEWVEPERMEYNKEPQF
ncbi:MAG: BNR-4 repeat-containing protein [Bacteroidales bacterium]|nr:BNR-4 repeat-containing protein [Bacteroidales bacterium]